MYGGLLHTTTAAMSHPHGGDGDGQPLLRAVEPTRRNPRAGALAALAAAIIMAGYLVFGKWYTGGDLHHTGGFLLARQLIASVAMLIAASFRHGCILPQPEHRRTFSRLGFLNFLNAVAFVWGFTLNGAFMAAVLPNGIIPVITYAYACIYGMETVSCRKTLGVLLIVMLGAQIGAGFGVALRQGCD